MTVPPPPAPREIWREFHWAFFLDTQGLILCMRRLDLLLERGEIDGAREELEAAAVMMEASGAAMRLAASFTREDYEGEIRVSMSPPNVASEGFSGLMSWEHGVLVNVWRGLRPRFAALPEALAPAHGRFVRAYREMAEGHVGVCARFVGEGAASLRYDDRDALMTLRRFGRGRGMMLDPAGAVPAEEATP
ncbi:MAG: hypothetical protein ACK5MQ_07410 [Pikeienuella sp.]